MGLAVHSYDQDLALLRTEMRDVFDVVADEQCDVVGAFPSPHSDGEPQVDRNIAHDLGGSCECEWCL